MSSPDVIIVGGGVIGLSIAYALTREGVAVTVLDRGPMARAASWAGAGIVSPGATRPSDDPRVALRTLSARLHAEWAEALRAETGIDNGYRRCGGLDVAWTASEAAHLDHLATRWAAEGIRFHRLDSRDVTRLEPALSPDLRLGYDLPDRAQIRNPRHLRALLIACEHRGVRLLPDCGTEDFQVIEHRVTAVNTTLGAIPCDQVVVAAGPWSAALLQCLGLDVPTPPVKGQIVLLNGGDPVIGRIVECGKNYLVPRDDGRILIGATEEHAGFNTQPTALGVRDLIDFALRLCPALESLEVEGTWAGLRPGSIDGCPTLGPAPGFDNVFVATGHHRSGLQLSPGTATLLAELILGRSPSIPLAAFRPGRLPGPEDEPVFRS